MMMEPRYFLGLDLGQTQDHSALCIAVQTEPSIKPPRRRWEFEYAVRHLERFPLGTSYLTIVERVKDLLDTPLSRIDPAAKERDRYRKPLHDCVVAVDGTGVGRAVVDMFRHARLPCEIKAVTIVGGIAPVSVDAAGFFHVAKKELVSVLQVLLQSRRLAVSKNLPNAEILAKEMLAFRVKITAAANETFEAWRERDHDDLVLAVALACWAGEREPMPPDDDGGPFACGRAPSRMEWN